MTEQEDDAVREWFKLHEAYHAASAIYNARLTYVRSERARTQWTFVGNCDHEYQVLNDAQKAATAGAETLYQKLRAALSSGDSETTSTRRT